MMSQLLHRLASPPTSVIINKFPCRDLGPVIKGRAVVVGMLGISGRPSQYCLANYAIFGLMRCNILGTEL